MGLKVSYTYTMKRMFAFGLMVVGLAFMAVSAFASTVGGKTDSEILTQGLYCGIKGLIEGQLGLLVGLVFVTTGLAVLIKGGKWVPALILVFTGAVITAVPNMINSFFEGYNSMLRSASIGSGAEGSFTGLANGCATKSEAEVAEEAIEAAVKRNYDPGTTSGNTAYSP